MDENHGNHSHQQTGKVTQLPVATRFSATLVTVRDTRYQAAVVDGQRLLLLRCGAEITAVRWIPLHEPAGWEPALCADPFLDPQLLRIRAALRDSHGPGWKDR